MIRDKILFFSVFGCVNSVCVMVVRLVLCFGFITGSPASTPASTPEGECSPLQHLAGFLSCMLWTLYGLPFVHPHVPHITMLTISFGVGCFMELVCLFLYFIYTDKKRKKEVVVASLLLEIIIVGILAAIVLNTVHELKFRSRIVGIIAIISDLGIYVLQLLEIKMALKTRNLMHLDGHVAGFSFVTYFFWFYYGCLVSDDYLAVACGIGALVCAVVVWVCEGIRLNKEREREVDQP